MNNLTDEELCKQYCNIGVDLLELAMELSKRLLHHKDLLDKISEIAEEKDIV